MMPDVPDAVGPEPGTAPPQGPAAGAPAVRGGGVVHHIELWVPDLARAERSWGWLLTRLGARPHQSWEHGRSWRLGDVYVVVEQSPALVGDRHERRAPGLNHLAFHAGPPAEVDALVAEAPAHGWRLMFA